MEGIPDLLNAGALMQFLETTLVEIEQAGGGEEDKEARGLLHTLKAQTEAMQSLSAESSSLTDLQIAQHLDRYLWGLCECMWVMLHL